MESGADGCDLALLVKRREFRFNLRNFLQLWDLVSELLMLDEWDLYYFEERKKSVSQLRRSSNSTEIWTYRVRSTPIVKEREDYTMSVSQLLRLLRGI